MLSHPSRISLALRRPAPWGALLLVALLAPASTSAQEVAEVAIGQPLLYHVERDAQRLEMTVNTSRILTTQEPIPQAQVNNPELLELTPLSTNQVQVHAKKAGVTQINIWDENDRIRTIDVIVFGDAKELTMILETTFPRASLKVLPLASSAIVSGYVDRPDDVGRIIMIAEDFYPKVINNITVGGVQQVVLHVQVMEVSRTRLRALGVDWASFNGDDFLISSVSGLIAAVSGGAVTSSGGETFSVGFVSGQDSFFGFLEWLRQNNLLKVLAEPKLVTVSGRPAFFNVGGEFPILVPQSLGTVSIEYKKFGTQVDFVPIVLGNGAIRLEVRPRVSEIDNTRSVTINSVTVPGLRVREIDTGAEMRAGQTLAIAGLVQTRVESESKGIPWISELPYVGVPFRRVQEAANEIELLILITPQIVEAMDPGEVPPCGPGTMTDSPCDGELFLKGYIEVPRCCPDDGHVHLGPGGEYPAEEGQILHSPDAEEVPPPEASPSDGAATSGRGRVMLRGRPTRLPRTEQTGQTTRRADEQVEARPARRQRAPTTTSNPDNPSQATTPRRSRPAERGQGQPGFIGDTGYDVE